MTAAINFFKTCEGQQLALDAVRSGDLKFVDAYRLCFPEDEKTLESMVLREVFNNAHLYQGRMI